MTLDEAIKHAKEKGCANTECGLEHRLLALWLEELKMLRKEVATLTHELDIVLEQRDNRPPLDMNVTYGK